MCFILDSNSFSTFFNPCCDDHYKFKPLHDWLYNVDGVKLVIGGTVYKNEIKKLTKYLGYLSELLKTKKLAYIKDSAVDEEEKNICKIVNDPDFDDPHMIALLIVSGCILFASKDKRADKYIKRKEFFPKGSHRPSIYRDRIHASLLTRSRIVNLKNVNNQ